MKRRLIWALALCGAMSSAIVPARSFAMPAAACDAGLDAAIPARPSRALPGSEFVQRLAALDADQREAAILDEILSGNVPQFMRRLVPVSLGSAQADGRAANVVVCVMPDYLAVGTDEDFVLLPMRLQTALKIADRFGFMLPTRKIVDAIYRQAGIHMQPQPLPAGPAMTSIAYYLHHNALLREQRQAIGAVPGSLIAGDKKDLVVTNRLWRDSDKVAIYGWHRSDGRAIQPLSTVHGARYADYSHGVRLVAATAYDNGAPRAISALLQDAGSAALLSDEGVIPRLGELVKILTARTLAPIQLTRAFEDAPRVR